MSDPRERIDEYLDGLLDDRERGAFEDALSSDPALRDEVERARRFERLLDSAHDSRAEERCGEKQMREDVLNTQHGKDQTGGTDP